MGETTTLSVDNARRLCAVVDQLDAAAKLPGDARESAVGNIVKAALNIIPRRDAFRDLRHAMMVVEAALYPDEDDDPENPPCCPRCGDVCDSCEWELREAHANAPATDIALQVRDAEQVAADALAKAERALYQPRGQVPA